MPNFPGSLDDDVSLYLAVNNARTRLTSGISESELTIPVVTTSGFPNQGFITILSNPDDITEAEAIRYVGISETTFSGVERGAGGTPIFPHFTQDNVDLTVMAEHHNELKDAIIEIEKILGVSGSHNFVPKDAQGNAIVSGTLTAENLFEAGWITASGSLVVCGEAQFKEDVLFEQNVNVSGVVQVGGPDVSADPGFYFDSLEAETNQDDIGTTEELVFEANFTPSIGKHVLIWRGSVGNQSGDNNEPEISVRFAGVELGFERGEVSGFSDGTYAADLSGFKVIDGDGLNKPQFYLANGNAGNGQFRTRGLGFLLIPLDEMGLVQNTDYFFSDGSDTAQLNGGTSYVTYNSSSINFTVTKPGTYLMLGYGENDPGILSSIRMRLNSVNQTTPQENSDRRRAVGFIRTVSLSAGANSADMQFNNNNAFAAGTNGWRGRVLLLNLDFFNQSQGVRTTSSFSTNSATYASYTPLTQSFQPQVQSQVLVWGFGQSVTNDVEAVATYRLRNNTTTDTYMENVGARAHGVFGDFGVPSPSVSRGAWLFTVLEDQVSLDEWSLQVREPTGNGAFVDMEEGFMLQWSNALPAGPDLIDFTTIAESKITTPAICVDNLDVNFDLGVSGTLTLEQGLTTATGTFTKELNASEEANLGWVTVTGTSDLCDDVDIKGDLTVSGTAKFGQAAPTATVGEVIFASNDTEQTTTSNSHVDGNCETAPLLDGVDYFVTYTANVGNSSLSGQTACRVDFGATKYGGHDGLKSNLGTFGNNHYNDSFMNGFFVVTGDGVSTIKTRFQASTAATTAYMGAQAIVCVPLDQLTEGTDYYYDTTGDTSDTMIVVNAPIQNPPNTVLLSSTFTGMAAGTWMFFWSSEQDSTNFTGRGWTARFQVDGSTEGVSAYSRNNSNGNTDAYNFAAAQTVDIPTGGDITCEILVASIAAGEADFRKGRIVAINTAAFGQVISSKDTTGLTTNSATYQDFTALNTTITPTQTNAPIIIMSSATTYTQNSNSAALHALRNETDAIDYRDESGERDTAIGGSGGQNLGSIFMVHFEERSLTTEYRHQIKTAVTGDVSVGRNDDDTGGEPAEMIVWEFTPVAPFVPITQTCIDDDEIQTGTVIADNIFARVGLTVSGVPVTTGTYSLVNGIEGSVVISGAGNVTVTEEGPVIVISGSGGSGGGGVETCYTHVQSTASTTWDINHQLGSPNVNYIVLSTGSQQVYPDTFTIDDADNVTITFAAPQDGSASIFPCGGTVVTGTTILPDPLVVGTGIINSLYVQDLTVSGAGDFLSSLTISGVPVATGTGGGGTLSEVPDPLVVATGIFNQFSAEDITVSGAGDFLQSLTISGVPVATGTGGGGTLTEVPDPLVVATGIITEVYSDIVSVSGSLTISGSPVSTGTIDTQLLDDTYVNVTGDEMTGNLDMQGNNIYNAGVVAIQDDTPTVVTSGLLWFDTDAPGGAFSSINLPGGYLGSLVAATTGTTTNTGAWSTIGFDAVEYDRGDFYDPAFPSRLTVPSGVTRVELASAFRFDLNSTGDRRIQIYKNGVGSTVETTQSGVVGVTILRAASASDHLMQTFTPVLEVGPGDYFETRVNQDSGGNLDVEPQDKWFAIKAVDTKGVPGVNTVNLLQGDVSLVAGSGIAISSNNSTNQIEIGFSNQVSDAQIWNPDAPPAVPSAYDDEWLVNGLDSKWTDWDEGTACTTETANVSQMLRLRHNPPSSAASLAGVFQDAPSGDFTVYAKFHYLNNVTIDFHEFGLLFAEDLTNNPSTANFGVVAVPAHRSGGETETYFFGLATQHFNNYSSFDTNKDFRSIQFPANEPIYVRARVDVSARTVTTDASLDGIKWTQPVTGDFSGDLTTIDEIGVWANSGSTTEMIVHNEFFRVVEHTDPTLPMQGDFVTLSGIPQSAIVISGSGGGGSGDGNITDINTQEGPSITISGAGSVDVITEPNLIIVSGTEGGQTSGTATVSGCYSHNQTVATGTWTVDHDLGTQSLNYIVLDNAGSQVQADDFTIVDDNQVTIDFVTDRTGIANIFACVDDEVTFNGGTFSSITAVTGTFTTGITVGSGTTYITGSGIDTPELKINGQSPSFGGGALEFIGSYTSAGTAVAVELPSGYRTFELHMVDFENTEGATELLQVRQKTEATPSYTSSMDGEFTVTAVRSNHSSLGTGAADELNNSGYQTASRFYLHPVSDSTYRLGIDADQKFNGVLKIHQMGSASNYPSVTWEAGYFANDDRYTQLHGSAMRYEKSKLTGLRFELNAGGSLTGTVYLYGYPE